MKIKKNDKLLILKDCVKTIYWTPFSPFGPGPIGITETENRKFKKNEVYTVANVAYSNNYSSCYVGLKLNNEYATLNMYIFESEMNNTFSIIEEPDHKTKVLEQSKNDQFKIKKLIFNNPATIVFWKDGTKTVVKANGEKFDKEKGLAMCFAKKALGNKYGWYNYMLRKMNSFETDEDPIDNLKRWKEKLLND